VQEEHLDLHLALLLDLEQEHDVQEDQEEQQALGTDALFDLEALPGSCSRHSARSPQG
jgi:hypothetical protein